MDVKWKGQTLTVLDDGSFSGDENGILLMEWPESKGLDSLLLETRELGVFKGLLAQSTTETAVFCTQKATYSLRQVSTSNTLLLAHPESLKTVSLSSYLELQKIPPKLERLKDVLEAYPYKGPIEEQRMAEQNTPHHNVFLKKLKWESLLNTVQASPSELQQALQSLNAIEIQGSWRWIDRDYLHKILKFILLSLEELGLDIGQDIDPVQIVGTLNEDADDMTQDLLCHVLGVFSEPSAFGNLGASSMRLSEFKITRFVGEQMLMTEMWNGSHWKKFVREWVSRLPEGFKGTTMEVLKGLAFLEYPAGGKTSLEEAVIRYFPKSSFDMEPKARFQQLFLVKKKWPRQDLLPYVEDLVDPPGANLKKLDALLLKHTRSSKDPYSGQPVYSSR